MQTSLTESDDESRKQATVLIWQDAG